MSVLSREVVMQIQENTFKIPVLSDEVWGKLSPFIEGQLGIRMPDDKRHMLQNRLLRRVRHLGLETFEEYVDYLFTEEGSFNELTPFFNEVTTNKTFFFREYRHFEVLSDRIIPDYLKSRKSPNDPFRVWSSACSTGEELYSIACIIEEYMRTENVSFPYEIMGTDVSTRVLWQAHDAIYDEDQIGMISKDVAFRYFLRGKSDSRKRRVIPAIRSRVKLRKLNLMDESYPLVHNFDAIFCRNVLIYFSREDIIKIVTRQIRHLKQSGYLITGHADSIYSVANQLTRIEPSIFRKP